MTGPLPSRLSSVAVCQGCEQPFGERHRPECPYWHPWPRDRVDNVQTQIKPV